MYLVGATQVGVVSSWQDKPASDLRRPYAGVTDHRPLPFYKKETSEGYASEVVCIAEIGLDLMIRK